MYYLSLNKLKAFFVFIFFILVILAWQNLTFKAEDELVLSQDESVDSQSDFTEDEVNDYENSAQPSKKIVVRNSKYRSDPLEVNDKYFTSEKNVTFKDLVFRVMMIILFSVGVLLLVKFYFSNKGNLLQASNLIEEFAQKFNNNFSSFSNFQGLKLKQTLMLTPGQNIYLVEVDGKKLLIGGTHQGGIQFLADLTAKQEMSSSLLEANTMALNENNNGNRQHEVYFINNQDNLSANASAETPFLENVKNTDLNPNKLRHPSFRKRSNFRQSILRNGSNNNELIGSGAHRIAT